jgi:ABC-type sugar transport system permease subunit
MIILFLAPITILYLVFFIYPSINSFYVSLFDWNGLQESMKFIGIRNFVELIRDQKIWSVVIPNTLKIIFLGGFLVFALSFFFSGILTTKIRGRKLFRAILFFPAVLSPVAVAILWNFIYSKQWGLLNGFLKIIGLGAFQRTWSAPETMLYTIIIALVWMNTGLYTVMLVAGLDRIPASLLECADIEGASEIRKFFQIKLPLIRDVLTTSIILWCISAVKEFGLLFTWSGGIDIPPDGSQNLAVRMYITAFGRRSWVYRMGYATTIGVLMFAVVGIIVFAVYWLNRKHKTVEY